MASLLHQRRFCRALALPHSASSARPPGFSLPEPPLTSAVSPSVLVERLLRAPCRPPVSPFLRAWPWPDRPGPDELSSARAARCSLALAVALFQALGLVAGALVS